MPRNTRQQSDSRRARILQRVLRGRKRVQVATWKWAHPQAITTLQRVPLPPQRLLPGRRLENVLMRFSEFLNLQNE